MGGHLLWAGGGGRGWVEVYFGWMGVCGHIYGWVEVEGGEWRYILSGWGWVNIFYW